MRTSSFACFALLALGCDCGGGGGPNPPTGDASVQPSDTCGSVRLTEYAASNAGGWCEFPRNASFLPQFVRNGLTGAIAEPWNGSSYEGDPGESCGECWEIDTINATEIIMIADLCPIEGNPLCAGAHFHIDLASEAADALGGGANDEGSARRVPCPVTGNVHIRVLDRNPTYLRFAPMNHRLPIRLVEFRGAGPGVAAENPWTLATRSGGAWNLSGNARGGTGVSLRFTSVQGEVVESTEIIPLTGGSGVNIDLGVQLTDQAPANGGACRFTPPATIYAEEFGGIDQMRWMINAWGAAENGPNGPYDQDCYAGTSCLRVRDLDQWSGFHLYYRQPFPTDTFSQVTLRARTVTGAGMINVAPSDDGERCTNTTFAISETYTDITIDIASVCGGLDRLNALTIDNPGADIGLLLDDVQFVP